MVSSYKKRRRNSSYKKLMRKHRHDIRSSRLQNFKIQKSTGLRQLESKKGIYMGNIDFRCSALDIFRKIDSVLKDNNIVDGIFDVLLISKGRSALLNVSLKAADFLLSIKKLELIERYSTFSKDRKKSNRLFRKYSELAVIKPVIFQLGNLGEDLTLFQTQWEFKKNVEISIVPEDRVLTIIIAKSFALEISFTSIEYEKFHFLEDSSTEKLFILSLSLKQPPKVFKKAINGEKKKIRYWSKAHIDENIALADGRVVVGDFTRTGALGYCCRYRFCFLSSKEREAFIHQLQLFDLINLKKQRRVKQVKASLKKLRMRDDIHSWTGSKAIDSLFEDIPFNICYSLQIFIATNRACLVVGDNAKVVHDLIKESIEQGVSHRIIQTEIELLEKQVGQKFLYRFPSILKDVLSASKNKIFPFQEHEDRATEGVRDVFQIRRIVITPLRIIPQPIDIEKGNRMLRNISSENPDRFVRANIASDYLTRIQASTKNILYKECAIAVRLDDSLRDGVCVGGRTFKFLAHSNSQLKSHSCWLYDEEPYSAEEECATSKNLRSQIGFVDDIHFIGKRSARVGQAFSSTTQALKLKNDEWEDINDIERNGFVFSDGVGLISMEAAKQVAKALQLDFTPSAFQVRLGGYKGMLCQWPDELLGGKKILFRQSMSKFPSNHSNLEICRHSTSHPFHLNKQLISIFTALGVQDSVFMDLYLEHRSALENALLGSLESMKTLFYSLYNTEIDQGNSVMHVAIQMIDEGMNPIDDEFFGALLNVVCHRQLFLIKEKLRIRVNEAICVLGVIDELGILEEGEVFVAYGSHGIDNESPIARRNVIQGSVVVGRNPSVHCGDLRALTAVDKPEFSALTDVIIFSQKGSRPAPDMMSGGDLDGDEYFVIWNNLLTRAVKFKNFNPQRKDYELFNSKRIGFKRSTRNTVDSIRNEDDAISFFVKFILTDNLGVIANAFLVWADLKDASCDQCMTIATLHSAAVDFAKSGHRAVLPNELRPKDYPDFMGKDEAQSYQSLKIMGKIYRDIRDHDLFEEDDESDAHSDVQSEVGSEISWIDEAILDFEDCIFYSDDYGNYWEEAEKLQDYYNTRLANIKSNYGIVAEAEVLSGFCITFHNQGKRVGERHYQLQERLNDAVKALIKDIKHKFWKLCGFESFGEFEVSLDEVQKHRTRAISSALYFITYSESENKSTKDRHLSLPWVVASRVLFQIRRMNIEKLKQQQVDSEITENSS